MCAVLYLRVLIAPMSGYKYRNPVLMLSMVALL